MAIKLTTVARYFTPDIMFVVEEEGNEVLKANRDLTDSEQVRCEISIASIGQKNQYLGSYTVANRKTIKMSGDIKQFTVFQFEKCVSHHVPKITGLEAFGITNGKSLVAKQKEFEEARDIIEECFFKINGIHADDTSFQPSEDSDDFETSDAGEMSLGESEASA